VTTTAEWLERYAAALGVDPPSGEELNDLLGLAGIAAHAAERTAAPVSCWLAARAGLEPGEAKKRAGELAEALAG
jgi:hypothetical protein